MECRSSWRIRDRFFALFIIFAFVTLFNFFVVSGKRKGRYGHADSSAPWKDLTDQSAGSGADLSVWRRDNQQFLAGRESCSAFPVQGGVWSVDEILLEDLCIYDGRRLSACRL